MDQCRARYIGRCWRFMSAKLSGYVSALRIRTVGVVFDHPMCSSGLGLPFGFRTWVTVGGLLMSKLSRRVWESRESRE
jgi:hypothetical protein